MKIITFILSLFISFQCIKCSANSTEENGQEIIEQPGDNHGNSINLENMKLKIIVNGTELRALLVDNSATRDFIKMLPLSVTVSDYASAEKIFSLPSRLSTTDTPSGYDPSIGDIAYYAPWANMAIFYRDAPYANGLVPIAKIEENISVFQVGGSMENVKIELIENQD